MKKIITLSYIIMFVMIMILSLPLYGWSFQIKRSEITRVGDIVVNCNYPWGCQYSRPVMVWVTYSCDNNPEKLFFMDCETRQIKDKWGEWNVDDYSIKEKIQQQCAKQIEILINSGNESYKQGDLKTAIINFNKAIELNPKDANVNTIRGMVYNELGKFNEAIVDLNKAIEIDPKNSSAYNNRGFTYSQLGKFNEAIVDLNKAIEIDPKNSSAYNNRGLAYMSLGKYNEAIVDFNKAIVLNPIHAYAYMNRGLAYVALEKYNEAIADCNKAIELNPKYSEVYFSRGIVYYKNGKYNEAIVDLNKAIKLNPKLANPYICYMLLGVSYNKIGET